MTLPERSDRHPWWVALGGVSSLDGSATLGGVSGQLGGPADRLALVRLRDAGEVILVGAGTLRAEDYSAPVGDERRRADRLARGLPATPRLAIVSGSGELDPEARALSHPDHVPLVLTTPAGATTARARLGRQAEIVEAGEERVDLPTALQALAARGLRRVVAEGGPSLTGQLIAADLIDEWFVTLAPAAVGGSGTRLATGEAGAPRQLRLVSAALCDHDLLLRYRRADAPEPT